MRGLIPHFRRLSGRLREQARSHSWSVGVREISVGCQVFTGAGSLATVAASCRSCVDIDAAMAMGQLTHLLLIYRYRRQASSHIGHVSLAESAPGSDPCGRGLARDGGGSVNSYTAIAGKPAPTLANVSPTKSAPGPDPCWSGLAREGGVSVTGSITEPMLS